MKPHAPHDPDDIDALLKEVLAASPTSETLRRLDELFGAGETIEQSLTLRLFGHDGKPISCRICGRFYNWIAEANVSGEATVFVCNHPPHDFRGLRNVATIPVKDAWCEIAHRFKIYAHSGEQILCDICGKGDRWVREESDPETGAPTNNYNFVCEHPAIDEHYRVFRIVRPVSADKVLYTERIPLVRD